MHLRHSRRGKPRRAGVAAALQHQTGADAARTGRRLHGGDLWASHRTRRRLSDDARSRRAQPDDGRGLRASRRDADGDDHGAEGDPQQPPGPLPDRRYRRDHAAAHQDGDANRRGAEHSDPGSRRLPGGAARAAGPGASRTARGYRGRRGRRRHHSTACRRASGCARGGDRTRRRNDHGRQSGRW